MSGGAHEDWLMTPVLRGLCRYESLHDRTLTLRDLAIMHDAIEVEALNLEAARG